MTAESESHASLLELLRCPTCGRDLAFDGAAATCGAHTFPVVDGIPVLLDEELLSSDPQYEQQRRHFDEEFGRYRAYRLENWRLSYLQRLASAGALGGTGAPLVDVGVGGSGYTVIEAAKAGRPAVGCDLSLPGLLAARRFAEQQGVAARTLFVCCSAERLPFADASFDVALAIAVIEHVPNDRAAIDELGRVLRPGGRAWITVPHALRHVPRLLRPANRRHDRRLGHLRRFDVAGLTAACAGAGLVARDTQFTGHAIKVAQLAAPALPVRRWREAFWWWCERRDLRRSDDPPGSMQLSLAFRREHTPSEPT